MGMKKAISGTGVFSLYILLILAVLYLLSGLYSISQSQIGVHQRFCRVVNPNVGPGIHYALPWPIGRVDKVPVKIVRRIVIDDFSSAVERDSIAYSFREMTGLTPCCISGDNNIVNILCTVQYTISKPMDYLFKIENNERLLRNIFCNAMIKCLARLQVDEILTYGKRNIENHLKSEVQQELDELSCGLMVSFVELRDVRPPSGVQSAFDDVINAKIDKRKIVNEAESYRNERIPRAKATANRMVEQARTYKIERILKAQGETQRFLAQLEVYQQKKTTTRKKLYLDFIREIFSRIEKVYIIESKGGKNPVKIKVLSGD